MISVQTDFFGEVDGRRDKVFEFISSQKYDGATPTEVSKAVRFGDKKVRECINYLLVDKKIASCGQREATIRSTKVEPIYKAMQFLTRDNPFARSKYEFLKDSEFVKVEMAPFDRESKDVCKQCRRPVVRVKTQFGYDELCDPQKRFVVFDQTSESLTGFEEHTGKFVAGRHATRAEADSLAKRNKCGKPWTVLRQAHYMTCKSNRRG